MRTVVHTKTCPPDSCCDPDTKAARGGMGARAERQMANLCRALGHPARVRILRVLVEKDVCIAGELADEVSLAASTVSQHLNILKEAGLIKGEVDGPRRCYCVDKTVLAGFRRLVASL